ncbi:MAG: heavy-metal-associated domain-containing protein [Acidobacteriota bacterium]|nr:heavy-metal-associated domain-containing protein [Acidobacteriota bacterium]
MKTSVMEVHSMLSVLSVDEVEKRIGKVPGVESVTVNFAGGSATVRYDETRLDVADIKSAVHQNAYESAPPATPSVADGHEDHTAQSVPPTTTGPAAPKAPPVKAAAPAAAPADGAQSDKVMSNAMPSMTPKSSPSGSDAAPAPTSAAQKPVPVADTHTLATTALAGDKPQDEDKD